MGEGRSRGIGKSEQELYVEMVVIILSRSGDRAVMPSMEASRLLWVAKCASQHSYSIFLLFLDQLEEHVTYLVCEVELNKKKCCNMDGSFFFGGGGGGGRGAGGQDTPPPSSFTEEKRCVHASECTAF